MRCYICNSQTQSTEIYWEEAYQDWSPCPKCVSKIKEGQAVEIFDGLCQQETPVMRKVREQ